MAARITLVVGSKSRLVVLRQINTTAGGLLEQAVRAALNGK
jgi:hypothetical protein